MSEIKVLEEIKVLDLSTVLAGPSVGTFFAELGAEVLKIEHPNHPDITRSWKLPTEDKNSAISAYFSSINYKKRYQKLDFTQEEDYQTLLTLVKKSNLILMNFKKGVQERLKITDEILQEQNPQLIIGKINGFGDDSDRVAYDLILQAESGIMSMNGTPESGPTKMPVAFIDVLAAHHLKEGILLEFLQKERNQSNYKGGIISVSLYDAAICSLVNQASNYLMENHIPQRIGSLHPNIAPYGELFTTKDAKTITFAIGSNLHFEKLCDFLGNSHLALDIRFDTVQNRVQNRKILFEILEKEVQKFSLTEIMEYMNNHFVPCGEIKDLQAVFSSSSAKNLVKEEIIEGIVTKRPTSIAFKKS